MANIRSQIKRNRQTERRHARNKALRSELRTREKGAVAEGADDLALKLALQRLDKAVTKGVIHKNQAARRKSRLVKRARAAAQ